MSKRTGLKLGSPIDRKLYGIHNRATARKLAIAKLTSSARVNATESVEQIDEISKDLALRYVAKAANSLRSKAYRAGHTGDRKVDQKSWRRATGIERAAEKVRGMGNERVNATESVEQIDELSKKTLKSYIVKSAMSREKNREAFKQARADFPDNRIRKRILSKKKRTPGIGFDGKPKVYESAIDEVALKSPLRSIGTGKANSGYMKVPGGLNYNNSNMHARINRRAGITNDVVDMSHDEMEKEMSYHNNKSLKYRKRAGDTDKIELIRRLGSAALAKGKNARLGENIDEVSQDLLKRYRNKAITNGVDAYNKGDDTRNRKRRVGFAKATMRLKGVSVKTLHKLKNPMFDDK